MALVDDPVAGVATGPRVDAERRDAEVLPDRPRGVAAVGDLQVVVAVAEATGRYARRVAIWTAERTVDEPLVRRLLAQFPELRPPRSLRPLSEGWDYAIWAVDEAWAFRFPRRTMVVPGTEREIAALPRLAPLLPLPVPEPVFVGGPTDDFPWPFFGSRLLPGRELGELSFDDTGREAVGVQLAGFLRALHTVDVDVDLARREPPRGHARARAEDP